MKILFDHPSPFFLAHGGFQTQIEQSKNALSEIGVRVDWLRWWDNTQTADIVHYFGRPATAYVEFVHKKGMKLVMSDLLTGLGSRSNGMRLAQKCLMEFSRALLPTEFTARLGWESYRVADACIALTSWEGQLMREFFGAAASCVNIVPNGVEPEFLAHATISRGDWLVCTATITERKRVLELTEAAILAKTPLRIFGRPYSESEEYYQRFIVLCERAPELIQFRGEVSSREALATIYREARGFVLLSDKESLSLSALEAAACDCPLFLSDLPWAHAAFGSGASYCRRGLSSSGTAEELRLFYDKAPGSILPPKPGSWLQIAKQLETVYEAILV